MWYKQLLVRRFNPGVIIVLYWKNSIFYLTNNQLQVWIDHQPPGISFDDFRKKDLGCAGMGFHAHHPRNCYFYIRDHNKHDFKPLLIEKGVAIEQGKENPEGGCQQWLEPESGKIKCPCYTLRADLVNLYHQKFQLMSTLDFGSSTRGSYYSSGQHSAHSSNLLWLMYHP